MKPIISRTFVATAVTISMTYNPENEPERQILVDHASVQFLSIDEAHQFHAIFTDFLAAVRESNGGTRPVASSGQDAGKDAGQSLHPSFPPTHIERRVSDPVYAGGMPTP